MTTSYGIWALSGTVSDHRITHQRSWSRLSLCTACVRFGRRKTILGYSVLKIAGVLLSMFSASYSPFVVGRFIIGFAAFGLNLTAFVLGNY